MESNIILAVLLSVVAGCFNGSWGVPQKFMTKWNEENTWFSFSFFGFLILPCLTLAYLSINAFSVIGMIPFNILIIAILGGLFFGLSQLFFALAFRRIGIGLSFIICISIGTSGAAIVPILFKSELVGSKYFYYQLIGVFLFFIAVCLGGYAGSLRDKYKKSNIESGKVNIRIIIIGLLFAILAGLGSACQGVSYTMSNPIISKIAIDNYGIEVLPAHLIAWIVIFGTAWIPFVLYFLCKLIYNKSFHKYKVIGTNHYWILALLSGIGFWGGLIFFSKASIVIGGDLAPTIAWPLFMVFIIFVSNIWGWITGEWNGASKESKLMFFSSILMFIAAIIIFAMNTLNKT